MLGEHILWGLTVEQLLAGVLAAAVASLITVAFSRRFGARGRLLSLALNNMTQGVVMFDLAGRLIVCNDRYREMYSLPKDLLAPGRGLIEIVRYRVQSRSLDRDPTGYCEELLANMAAGKTISFIAEAPNGRAIAVVNRSVPGTSYWVGTHDDVTERHEEANKSAALAEQETRRAAVDTAIYAFRTHVEVVLRALSDRASDMQTTAAALVTSSDETASHAAGAVGTSNQASDSVNTAANATDELSKSIAEINQQTGLASEVVGAAANEAHLTNARIAELAQAAQTVEHVVKLIHGVAAQTNLLALNATIEAARAGSAGRGFAVVASEVKSLAIQTGKATEEIATQIKSVQSLSREAVEAIGRIAVRMREGQQYTSAIAVAVEQQNAATAEISRNVAGAAEGAKSVVGVLLGVSSALSNTRGSAETVLAASRAVETAVEQLRERIE
jgi:methyl-accepting chemotaxis protein